MAADPVGVRDIHEEGCLPLVEAVRLLGRKGTFLIVWQLLQGPRRFGGLQDATGLPPRTLSQRLKEMERAGLVVREQFPEIPPRVEYTLTAAGEDLRSVLKELDRWGAAHMAIAVPDRRDR